MKLSELLYVIHPDQVIIVSDLENKNETQPMKAGNFDFRRLRKMGDHEVMNIVASDRGLFIQTHDPFRTKAELACYKVIDVRLRQLGLIGDKGIRKIF